MPLSGSTSACLSAFLLFGAAAHAASPSARCPKPPDGWKLVWSDEFTGRGVPNPSHWSYHVGNGFNPGLGDFQGWGNGEWEWYRPESCTLSNGQLVLQADYSLTP